MPTPPKREAELARSRSRKGGDQAPTIKLQLRDTTVPNIPKKWHPIARRLFESLKTSGQSDRFQDSDWSFAYLICDEISRYKFEEDHRQAAIEATDAWYAIPAAERKELIAAGELAEHPPHIGKGGSAMKMTALIDSLARLGMTEVDRLKVRVELVEPAPEEVDAEVVAIQDWKTRLRG